jgi:uncharacterized metal-binding protein
MSRLILGDDVVAILDLQTAAGGAANVAAATEVKAVLVDRQRSAALFPVVTCSAGTAGADWAAGKVAVVVSGAATAGITAPVGQWEVQVVQGGLKTTYLDVGLVTLVRGLIP